MAEMAEMEREERKERHSGARGPLGPVGEKGQPGKKGERAEPPALGINPKSWSTQEELEGAGTVRLVEQPTISACLTILTTSSMTQGGNYVNLTYYSGQPLCVNPDMYAHNAPCAICMAVSRCSLLMIPGKTSCPVSWTTEYVSYLMSVPCPYSSNNI